MNERYAVTSETVRDFMYSVYGWMSAGLGLTAGIAYYVSSQPVAFKTIVGSPLFFILGLAQIGIVFFLSWRINSMDYGTAVTSFLAYSALSGVTFSVYFHYYTLASLYTAFAITAGTFLAMAVYGYFTKSDLTAMGSYLVMGLFGIIIALFVNMWMRSPIVDYYISLVAVGIFTLLIAYDTQKIKAIAHTNRIDEETKSKYAIMGALMLYLDFINLFIHLVRLFGKRRQ